MDKKSLKNARLVSQSWNTQATSALSERLKINVYEFFRFFNYPAIDILPSKITTGLVKHIDWSDWLNGGQWESLTVFCEKYGTDVSKMNVQVSDFQDQLPFCKVLKEFCPNLEELYFFHNTDHNGDTDLTDGKYQSLTKRELPKTLALKRIIFETFFHTPELNSFVEDVIKLCPNLEDLTIDGEIYPDLSNNKILKSLKIVGISHFYWLRDRADPPLAYPSFNIKKINKMLEQVHSTLQTLVLLPPSPAHTCNHINWSCIAGDDYLFLPFTEYMHDLNVFINKSIFIFPLNSVSRLLFTCKNLHTIELSGEANDEESMRQMFKSLQPNSSVTNLRIGEIEQESVLRKIIRNLPSLRKLEFTIGKCTSIPKQKIKDKLQKFFEIASIPKLDELKIIIKCKYNEKLSFIWSMLSYNQNFLKGLQSLTIENQSNSDSEEELKDTYWEFCNIHTFKAALLRTRGMKRLELTNFHMRIASVVKIHEFVKKNKLPVHFLNR